MKSTGLMLNVIFFYKYFRALENFDNGIFADNNILLDWSYTYIPV